MNRFTEDYMCVNHLINKCTCIHNCLLCPLQRRRQSRLCRLSSCSWREHDWPTTSMTKSLTDRVPLSWSTRTSCLLTAICSTHSQVITHTSSAFTCTRLTPGTRSGKENVFIDGLALSFKCNHKFKSLGRFDCTCDQLRQRYRRFTCVSSAALPVCQNVHPQLNWEQEKEKLGWP